jgi:hypothetical protein
VISLFEKYLLSGGSHTSLLAAAPLYTLWKLQILNKVIIPLHIFQNVQLRYICTAIVFTVKVSSYYRFPSLHFNAPKIDLCQESKKRDVWDKARAFSQTIFCDDEYLHTRSSRSDVEKAEGDIYVVLFELWCAISPIFGFQNGIPACMTSSPLFLWLWMSYMS